MRVFALVLAAAIVPGCSESPENKFMSAVARNEQVAVERLLDDGSVDVNYRGRLTGNSALASACGLGHTKLTRLLLDRGADPNTADHHGSTPLLSAAYHGYSEIVTMLIQAGADVNKAETQYGFTPVATAAWKGHADTVRLLLDAGADPTVPAGNGMTPLQLAQVYGHYNVVNVLANRDVKIR